VFLQRQHKMRSPVIAVVDAAPEFLELMHDVLADVGYQTILWSTGKDAFEMILREQPDLVLLDLWLEHPKAGEMVLGLMQADPIVRKISVIITTTCRKFVGEKTPLLGDKRCSILLKPFDLSDLLAKIEEMIQPVGAKT
jgi:DNA-binding response OmpR family regulator